MKKHSRFYILGMLALWFGLTTGMRNPQNPPLASTGAPGENTCQRSGCHGGGSFTGGVLLTGLPDTIVAGQVYSLTLTHNSNATRAGFQITCLDSLNVRAGTLAAGTGSNLASASGRQYVRHSTFKTLSAGTTSWNFSWTAPDSAAGDFAKFYFTSLAANGNGNTSGDNVLTANKTVVFAATVSANDPGLERQVRIYPSPFTNQLTVELNEVSAATLRLFDTKGNLVSKKAIQSGTSEMNTAELPKGMYYAVITAGNRSTRKAVVKQ
ncbi:MAG: T9SS type A sorting domain-containing protein [Saprospiraceae bacterium]|nr:T9SS type A sorting domain-containing protein [Saprospiraceae bacterium]